MKKRQKTILTSERSGQQPFSGQNIQHLTQQLLTNLQITAIFKYQYFN